MQHRQACKSLFLVNQPRFSDESGLGMKSANSISRNLIWRPQDVVVCIMSTGKQMIILTKKQPVDVLLVVSDIQAVRQIRSALEDVEINDRVHHIGDMYEARDYLRREQPYQGAPQPGLIILEASLRNQSEIDLLAAINADPNLTDVSVALLTRTPSQNGSFEHCLYFTDAINDEPTSLQQLAQILSTRKS